MTHKIVIEPVYTPRDFISPRFSVSLVSGQKVFRIPCTDDSYGFGKLGAFGVA